MAQASSTAIIVYSKTGHSRRVAQHLGRLLGFAPTEITTTRYHWPVFGWIAAGRDALAGAASPLSQSLNVSVNDSVILVGPVWAGRPAAPLNTVLDVLKNGTQDVSVLLTCGDPGEDASAIQIAESRLGRPLKAGLVLSNSAQDTGDGKARIAAFAELSIREASVSA